MKTISMSVLAEMKNDAEKDVLLADIAKLKPIIVSLFKQHNVECLTFKCKDTCDETESTQTESTQTEFDEIEKLFKRLLAFC